MSDFSERDGLRIRQTPRGDCPVAIFEGRIPTPDEARRVVENRYGVNLIYSVDPEAGDEFAGLLPRLRYLGIAGARLDLGWLGALTDLEDLSVQGIVRSPADLAGLPHLRRYGGVLKNMESVLVNRAVTYCDLYDVRHGSLHALPPRAATVRLTDLAVSSALPSPTGEPDLEVLEIVGAKNFDASSLASYSRLRTVAFVQTSGLHGCGVFQTLPSLESVGLYDCRGVADAREIGELPDVSFDVAGRKAAVEPLEREFGGRRNWAFTVHK